MLGRSEDAERYELINPLLRALVLARTGRQDRLRIARAVIACAQRVGRGEFDRAIVRSCGHLTLEPDDLELVRAEGDALYDSGPGTVTDLDVDVDVEVEVVTDVESGCPSTADADDKSSPLPSLVCERYHVGERIGVGGQATVYAAKSHADPRARVAVKIRHDRVEDAVALRHFDRECDVLRRLSTTSNIVRIIDAGVDPASGCAFIVTPRYTCTLADRLASLGSLPIAEVISAAQAIGEALAATHAAGILHHDLKPANVFIDDDGRYLLGDFGASQIIGDHTITGSTAISVASAAPETLEAGVTSRASDLYGLGVTMYHLVTGRPPFHTPSTSPAGRPGIGALMRCVASEPPEPIDDPTVPRALRDLIFRLLEKQPGARPASAAEVVCELRAIADDPFPTAPPVARPLRTQTEPPPRSQMKTFVVAFVWRQMLSATERATKWLDRHDHRTGSGGPVGIG